MNYEGRDSFCREAVLSRLFYFFLTSIDSERKRAGCGSTAEALLRQATSSLKSRSDFVEPPPYFIALNIIVSI